MPLVEASKNIKKDSADTEKKGSIGVLDQAGEVRLVLFHETLPLRSLLLLVYMHFICHSCLFMIT